jgi:urea transport system ATP-binding protein
MQLKHIDQNAVLYLNGVSVSFDGFKALNSLSLFLEPGELRAIIGPNGAGKTTMMDVITGKTRPDEGDVIYKGAIDLTRHDEAAIANMGIGRKFQKPTVIESLTVFENLEMALAGGRGVFASLFHKLQNDQRRRIEEIVELVDLQDRLAFSAGSLSHGQKQWLEIGMLLIQKPGVLLIDEPAAGMTDVETEKTAVLFRHLAKDHTLVVVEHDMDFIKALDCKVTVLHEGSVLAEGTLEQVQKNEQVIEVYLGR